MVVDSTSEVSVSQQLPLTHTDEFPIDTHDTMNYHMSMYTGAKVIAIK